MKISERCMNALIQFILTGMKITEYKPSNDKSLNNTALCPSSVNICDLIENTIKSGYSSDEVLTSLVILDENAFIDYEYNEKGEKTSLKLTGKESEYQTV